MSKSRQQKVKNGKRRIERRLRRKNWSQQDEPMFKANNIHYELSERTRGIGVGGIGAVHKLALASGLVEAIDEKVDVLKVHLPYHESDHVLNIAYNILSGGTCLEDIELLRNDEVYLDGLRRSADPGPDDGGRFLSSIRGKRHQRIDGGLQRSAPAYVVTATRKNFLMKRRSMQTAPWWKLLESAKKECTSRTRGHGVSTRWWCR